MLVILSLELILLWLFCGSVLIGIGSLIIRAPYFSGRLQDTFWAGLAAVVVILQIYHFFRPIDSLVAGVLVVVGVIGLLYQRIPLIRQWIAARRETPASLPAMFLIAVLLAVRAVGLFEHYDTGLYGASFVRWFTTYPVVPGLANLHARFGFNSSVFLCVASLDQGILRGISYHLFGGLLLLVFAAMVICACERVVRGAMISVRDGFLVILLIPTVFWITRTEVVGTMTDLPATLCSLAALTNLIGALGKGAKGEPENPQGFSMAIILFALSITFKLSMIVLCGIGTVKAFIALLRSSGTEFRKDFLRISALFAMLLIFPWIVTNIVLSGYPFFPDHRFGLPVDWRVPIGLADSYAALVRSWAKIPHATIEQTADFSWLPIWFKSNRGVREGLIAPVVLGAAGALTLFARGSQRTLHELRKGAWILIPSLAGSVFWFMTAPSLRFGEAALWATAAILASTAIQDLSLLEAKGIRRLSVWLVFLVAVYCTNPRTLWKASYRNSFSIRRLVTMPTVRTTEERTNSGLIYFRPVDGDQCWEANLPCTPDFSPMLTLRSATGLRKGFTSSNR
jgi:hypothetical protein